MLELLRELLRALLRAFAAITQAGLAVLLVLVVGLLAACTAQDAEPRAQPGVTPTASVAAPSVAATVTAAPALTPPANCPNKSLATATLPPTSAPQLIAPSIWTTYTNTAYHYSIQYPASWFVYDFDKSPTTSNFGVYNFKPDSAGGTDLFPPYNKIELRVFPTSSQQSPLDFYHANSNNDPLSPPPCSRTVTSTTAGGHEAIQIVQWPYATDNQPPIIYPEVYYYVAAPGSTLLGLFEYYSPGGHPSKPFAKMIASLTFTA